MSDKETIKRLEQQILVLGKEVDEMRRAFNRQSSVPQQGPELPNDVMGLFGDMMSLVQASIELLLKKGVFSDDELQLSIEVHMDKMTGMVNIDPSTVEFLSKGEYSFMKFECSNAEGKVVFREAVFVPYQLGIGALPFESKLATCKPGDVQEFSVQFPDNFGNQKLKGQQLNVKLECRRWKRKIPGLGGLPLGGGKVVPISNKQSNDRPQELTPEGDLK